MAQALHSTWWPLRLISRLQNTVEILILPLRVLALLLEVTIGLGFLAIIAVAYGIYAHLIPNSVIIPLLNGIGGSVLGVLKDQGVF